MLWAIVTLHFSLLLQEGSAPGLLRGGAERRNSESKHRRRVGAVLRVDGFLRRIVTKNSGRGRGEERRGALGSVQRHFAGGGVSGGHQRRPRVVVGVTKPKWLCSIISNKPQLLLLLLGAVNSGRGAQIDAAHNAANVRRVAAERGNDRSSHCPHLRSEIPNDCRAGAAHKKRPDEGGLSGLRNNVLSSNSVGC